MQHNMYVLHQVVLTVKLQPALSPWEQSRTLLVRVHKLVQVTLHD